MACSLMEENIDSLSKIIYVTLLEYDLILKKKCQTACFNFTFI